MHVDVYTRRQLNEEQSAHIAADNVLPQKLVDRIVNHSASTRQRQVYDTCITPQYYIDEIKCKGLVKIDNKSYNEYDE